MKKTNRQRNTDPIKYSLSSKKLEQIRSGAGLERQTTSKQSQDVVIEKGGVKITEKIVHEKFEETAVLRKKRNYVMYESKLGTEKNREILKIEAPKQKPKIIKIGPRKEEKIITQKKRKEYLDNYQYLETKMLRKPKKKILVEHIRFGDILDSTYDTKTYQSQLFNKGRKRPRIEMDEPEVLSKTFYTNLRGNKNKQERSVPKKSASARNVKTPHQTKYSTSTAVVNRRTTTNIINNPYNTINNTINNPRNRQQIKSDVITHQIMNKRNAPKNQIIQQKINIQNTIQPNTKNYQINTYNPRNRRIKDQPKKDGKNSIKTITKVAGHKGDNSLKKNNSGRRIDQFSTITISRNIKDYKKKEYSREKTPKKRIETKIIETKIIKKEEIKPKRKSENLIDTNGEKVIKRRPENFILKKIEKKPKKIIGKLDIDENEEKRLKKKFERFNDDDDSDEKKHKKITTEITLEKIENKEVNLDNPLNFLEIRKSIRKMYKNKH